MDIPWSIDLDWGRPLAHVGVGEALTVTCASRPPDRLRPLIGFTVKVLQECLFRGLTAVFFPKIPKHVQRSWALDFRSIKIALKIIFRIIINLHIVHNVWEILDPAAKRISVQYGFNQRYYQLQRRRLQMGSWFGSSISISLFNGQRIIFHIWSETFNMSKQLNVYEIVLINFIFSIVLNLYYK